MEKQILKVLYWILSLTWGAILSIPGLIGLCILGMTGCPIIKNGFSFIVVVGNNWGGLNLGIISFVEKSDEEYFQSTRRHEFGHSLQNIVFGPLQLFIVAIPSVIRYWYQTIRDIKRLPNKPYDQAIFEYTASKWGYWAINKIEGTNLEYKFKRQ